MSEYQYVRHNTATAAREWADRSIKRQMSKTEEMQAEIERLRARVRELEAGVLLELPCDITPEDILTVRRDEQHIFFDAEEVFLSPENVRRLVEYLS